MYVFGMSEGPLETAPFIHLCKLVSAITYLSLIFFFLFQKRQETILGALAIDRVPVLIHVEL